MVALASTDDLRAALQDSSLDEVFAQSALDRASALVRAVAGQQLDFLADDVVELAGGERSLTLPERPVVVDVSHPLTVEELSLTGSVVSALEGQSWYRLGDRLIRSWPSQVDYGRMGGYGRASTMYGPGRPPGVWADRVRVTYSHGFLTIPDEIVAIVLSAAVTLATNPQGLRAEQVGGITLTWAAESVKAPRDMVEQIRADLKTIGIRRSGVFSARLM